MKNRYLPTLLCSVLHFLVDGLCCCCLFLASGSAEWGNVVTIFMIYNLLAFATQPFSGILADKLRKKHWIQLVSILLLMLAIITATISQTSGNNAWFVSTAVFLGLGNSLFHVWGGKQTAITTGCDIRALGVFVSTGALGLSVGFMLCSWVTAYSFIIMIALISLAYLSIDNENVVTVDTKSENNNKIITIGIIALIALFVMFRSFLGEKFSSGGGSETSVTTLLVGLLAMSGKISGGFLAKFFGNAKTFFAVTLTALICLALKNYSPIIASAGLFLINCTMPITLYWADKTLPGREGLAFGILAATLMPGYLLSLI